MRDAKHRSRRRWLLTCLLLAGLAASIAIKAAGLRWHLARIDWVPAVSVWCGIIGFPVSLASLWLGWLPLRAQRSSAERARSQLLDAQGDRLAQLVPTRHELIPLTLSTASGSWTGLPAALPELFDALGGQFVILGAAGSGKTTLALLLGDLLYRRAQTDAACPVPVLFELSRWPHWLRSSRADARGGAAKPSLADWMAAELALSHGLSPRTARLHLRAHRILPILDGLDEIVDAAARESCLDAVGRFLGAAAVDPLILSCRDGEFRDLDRASVIRADSRVTIEPLPTAQIVRYLRLWPSPALDPLIRAIAAQPAGPLARVLGTSLWLRTVAGAAASEDPAPGLDTALLSAATSEGEVKNLLWDGYLARQTGSVPAGGYGEARTWLTWMARALQGEGEQVFWTHELYRYVDAGECGGELYRVAGGLVVLAAVIAAVGEAVSGRSIGTVLGGGLVLGLIAGACAVGLGEWVLVRSAPVITRQPPSPRSVLGVIRRDLRSAPRTWLRRGAMTVLIGSVPLGILFGITLGLSGGWAQGFAGLLLGPLLCVLAAVTAAALGLLTSFGRALLARHTEGLASDAPAVDRIRHGVLRRSARTGLAWGIWLGVIFGGIAGLLAWLVADGSGGSRAGLALSWLAFVSLPVFVATAIPRGLGAPAGYWLRRRALARRGMLPRGRLRPFLDWCTEDEHRLLRRSGASYRFIHRELQEHLAAQSVPRWPIPSRRRRDR